MPTIDLGRVRGADGVGVPTGGNAGQILTKASNANHDTKWVDIPKVEVDSTLKVSGKAADAKVTGDALGQLSQQLADYRTAENLLVNSNFPNAVNQRGKTSFADSGYFIDLWGTSISGTLGAMHFSISGDEGLKMISTVDKYVDIYQQLELYARLKGKLVTFAAKIMYKGQETIAVKSFTLGSLGSGASLTDDGKAVLYSIDDLNVCIRLYGNNGTANELTMRWAALYEGTYTVETLPPYVAPDPVLELAKCKRYYRVYENYYANGFSNSATNIVTPIDAHDMIAIPSIASYTIPWLVVDGQIIQSGFTLAIQNKGRINITLPREVNGFAPSTVYFEKLILTVDL